MKNSYVGVEGKSIIVRLIEPEISQAQLKLFA